jgi:GNAT superfamily N-acetyltransferase
VKTEFRRATANELRSLMLFDRKTFHEHPADWFDHDEWAEYDPWWMTFDGRKVGCCAFIHNIDFQEDVREDGTNPHLLGSLYIATTGILPGFQGLGLGRLLKSWQVCFARRHKFTRLVTNMRSRNHTMIRLNTEIGFQIIRTTPDYYRRPREATVVMELLLRSR